MWLGGGGARYAAALLLCVREMRSCTAPSRALVVGVGVVMGGGRH
jgi:hypothetical protein